MANFVYTHAAYALMTGAIDFATDDIRVALVMTNTTADTELDVDNIDAFSTLDECDGANYVRKALADEAVTEDEANDRAEFDATDVTWTALGTGTRQIQGIIVYQFNTDDTDALPICWIDDGLPADGGGNDLTLQWNAEGILQAASA